MTDQPGSREYVLAAFAAILAANTSFQTTWVTANQVQVYTHEPVQGFDIRSVVISVISAVSRSAGVGLRQVQATRGFLSMFRLQFSHYYDDPVLVSQLADAVEQALIDAVDTFRSTYDIHLVRKILDLGPLRKSPQDREWQVNQDYSFYSNRALTA